MNKLEQKILEAAVESQALYMEMTGGNWWLGHGPEWFLHSRIAEKVKDKNYVFLDASPKKIKAEIGNIRRGRPSQIDTKRFDIVIWWTGSNTPRAIVEVKRAYSVGPVKKDAEKIRKYLNGAGSSGSGYLVVYSEAKSVSRLKDRFSDWCGTINCTLFSPHIEFSEEDDMAWGVALFRLEE